MESIASEPKPISKIAEELGLRWNTVQLYVNELSTLGIVETVKQRTAPPVTLVKLTDKGRKLLECINSFAKNTE